MSTGRLSPARAPFWESQLVEERSRTGAATQTEATLRSLSPVYDTADAWRPAVAESSTPLLDELDEAMFGPSEGVRRRREDLAAEAALAEAIEREREEAAKPGLTEAEEQAMFGDPQ